MPEFSAQEIKYIVEFVKGARERLKTLADVEKLAVDNQRQIRENQRHIEKNQESIKQLYDVLAGTFTNGKKGLIGKVEELEKKEEARQEIIVENRKENRKLRYTVTGGVIIFILTFLIQIALK